MRSITTVLGLGAVLATGACEPPPDPQGDIDIRVVYPPASDPDEGGPFRVEPNPEGGWEVLVVVDVPGITFVDPYTGEPPNDPGEGHWHLFAEEQKWVTSFTHWAVHVVAPATTPGTLLGLTASLRQNDHEPRTVDSAPVEATIEVCLVDDTTTSCDQ